jgi:hypothetical protein
MASVFLQVMRTACVVGTNKYLHIKMQQTMLHHNHTESSQRVNSMGTGRRSKQYLVP